VTAAVAEHGERPVALVTGAASGIGAAITARQRARGWIVAGLDLHASDAELPLIADVTDAPAVTDAVARAQDRFGRIDAVVSAAGYYEMIAIDEITPEQWSRMLRVHLGGLLNCARAVLPAMIARRGGRIVAISSELAIGGGDGDAHYAAAKGAALGLMRSLAVEVAPHGILVNAVAPGPTDTPLLAPDSPWRAPAYLTTLPARRLTRPDEVARVVRFVLEEGTFLAGEVLSVNSGAVI
jgi:NAD(P)-dependent dehydrogenase (short-subunit alcohol dehydrogenase family)